MPCRTYPYPTGNNLGDVQHGWGFDNDTFVSGCRRTRKRPTRQRFVRQYEPGGDAASTNVRVHELQTVRLGTYSPPMQPVQPEGGCTLLSCWLRRWLPRLLDVPDEF